MNMPDPAAEKGPLTHDPSSTAAFQALADLPAGSVPAGFRAVVIGGGTGAPVSIRTLLSMGAETSAVVAMADDGGSTGALRDAIDATAPGDVRKCIAAMAADPSDPLTRAFKTRFTFAENHTLGNLMLSALEATSGSFVEAVRICEGLLHARGRVYPSTLTRVNLVAEARDGRVVRGQALASHSRTALSRVWLEPEGPGGIEAYEGAVRAIERADLVVLGPGSLFTSIIPNLVVPGIVEAIDASRAPVLFVCSLADMQGETRGMSALEHYEALCAHGMAGRVGYVLAHAPQGAPDDRAHATYGVEGSHEGVRPVSVTRADVAAMEAAGSRVLVRDLVDVRHPTWHDPAKLQRAFLEVVRACPSPRM